ncbi:2Fe-2S iron-sulfur cluster-binding protein [Sulfurovum sp.]|uniref:2Fe-2S iron-sulfur cluster-binding protein n=1 Tax=Sulfurovum sp. TaxID=1969726 RepID=UPI00286829F6|nr:2Fe-2S iron-sulfur cluster-binding protein [Sulfurovum sp.]
MSKQHNSLGFGKEITLTIDGKSCKSTFGKTILEIARENDIYIPTMCYLTKVLPIASCRMCIVDVEGVDGAILSCQEKAVDGAVITTQNDELYTERQNIMKLYNVNHPLECGVCDKSGECDLQNKTMEFDVEEQPFTARDQHRPVENWGHVSYNPALCIMCEKCVRVSTEITGDEALQLKFGGYSSTIVNTKPEKNYASLGEAAAVCPVGALTDTNFKYTTNAWELEKIPSACPHCGGGCQMTYEVKHDTIYRMTNNFEFTSLCGAGRYGFDYANKEVSKDGKAFIAAVEAMQNAQSILFAPQITNEEALILQKIKEKTGAKLVCGEARAYQNFMQAYSSVTGKTLYTGTLKGISESKAVIVMGTKIYDDSPTVKYHINMASKWHRARVAYMHPIEDEEMKNIVTQYMPYNAGDEEQKAAELVAMLLRDIDVPEAVKSFIAKYDNTSDAGLEKLRKSLIKKSDFSLVVGSDLYAHPRAKQIAKILALLEKYADFNVVCVPPAGNAMGVSLICELDDEATGKTLGYNVQADFTLSALGNGDLDMPALNQQEGTLTTNDKRVVPMNVAQPYDGYVLNDIANALGLNAEYTVDYTKALPTDKGFEAKEFDTLPDYFDTVGTEHRGYLLTEQNTTVEENLEEVVTLDGFDSALVYHCNPKEQFSAFTHLCEPLAQETCLIGSSKFAQETKLSDGDSVSFVVDGVTFERIFKVDTSMRGTLALNPSYDMGLYAPLVSSYRFSQVEIMKVGS